jgi:ectoine hydroxylase-related dioxygenase (phytanoyl-CoA dioxygenase family)
MKNFVHELNENGFVIIENVIDSETVKRLQVELDSISLSEAVRKQGQSVFGIRNLLKEVPFVAEIANGKVLRKVFEPIAGNDARVIRAIYFDKTPEANWKVAWHQDLTIAVKEKRESEGFQSWSVKAGIVHVQPPASILEKILTIRLHLDHTDESNGALRVLPRSHKEGRLNANDIERWKTSVSSVSCVTPGGGALLMRPLLLHASSKCSAPSRRRRVVHLEFSATELPDGLDWHGS